MQNKKQEEINLSEQELLIDEQEVEAEKQKLREQQERKKLEKKLRKKAHTRKVLVLGILLLLLAGIGILLFLIQKKKAATQGEVVIEVQSDEERVEGSITSLIGNDMTLSTTQDEVKTYEIPVGTQVTTKLGTVTTFQRLAAGDYVIIITQKDSDNILRIYISEKEEKANGTMPDRNEQNQQGLPAGGRKSSGSQGY